jgi:DNA ligase-1
MIRWIHLAKKIEGATRTTEKVRLLADALRAMPDEELETACRLLISKPIARRRAGVEDLAWSTIARAVEEVASAPAGSLAKLLEESGDLGLAVEELFESERPIAGEALAAAERSAAVQSAAIAVAEGEGRAGGGAERSDGPRLADLPAVFAAIRDAGGQRRHDLISQLLFGCSPIAAKYVVRMLTGDLRIGLRDGLFEAALTEAYGAPQGEVHRAMILEGDAGTVALLAKRGELAQARLRLFHAIPPMLADAAKSASNIVERSAERSADPIAVEDKYDGVRAQLHVAGDRVAIYGRDLDEVTVAFPEIVAAAQAAGLHGIFDGEIVGWSEEGQLPATSVMLRLSGAGTSLMQQGRAPAIFIAFDCLAHGEKSLLDEAYATRRIALETSGIATAGNGTIRLADARVVHGIEEIEAAFITARMRGAEGLVAKSTAAPYAPGRRGSAWLKLKRPLDTIDCIVVGVAFGSGKRRAALCDYTFAVRDDLSGRFAAIGHATADLPEDELVQLSSWFDAHTVAELDRYRSVEPRVVVEVAFDEVRRSAGAASGFSLRGPRIVRVRHDLGPDQATTLAALELRCRTALDGGEVRRG